MDTSSLMGLIGSQARSLVWKCGHEHKLSPAFSPLQNQHDS